MNNQCLSTMLMESRVKSLHPQIIFTVVAKLKTLARHHLKWTFGFKQAVNLSLFISIWDLGASIDLDHTGRAVWSYDND